MAKAAELDIDLAASEQPLPLAATNPRTPKAHAKPKAPKMKMDTPVNFRWPAAEVKRMKRAALDADMKIQDYMLTCFHAFLKD
jgi:hypothetical protein